MTPILPLRSRFYPGTAVADGTQFLRVKFPKEVASLPYSVRFDTGDGPLYFRVMHDRQVKICRLCMSPVHVMRVCPQFVCRECLEKGHYARSVKQRAVTPSIENDILESPNIMHVSLFDKRYCFSFQMI